VQVVRRVQSVLRHGNQILWLLRELVMQRALLPLRVLP